MGCRHIKENLQRRATCSKFQLSSTGPLCPGRQVSPASAGRSVFVPSAPGPDPLWERGKKITPANSPLCSCPLTHHPQLPGMNNSMFSWQQASCSLRESKLIAFIITAVSHPVSALCQLALLITHLKYTQTSIHLHLSVLCSAGYYSLRKQVFS